MKFKNLLWLAVTVLLFTGCKKDKVFTEQPALIDDEAALEYAKDSIAYTIDGVAYTLSKYTSHRSTGNRQPHSKIDSIVNYTYYISGRHDSVLYSREFLISNDSLNVNIIFAKTYSKTAMWRAFLWMPKDVMSLFSLGSRNYILDYGRDNIQNGVAFQISNGFKTFGSESFRTPPQLSPDAQKDSEFEITKLRKLKSGTYILEARFNAVVFNDKNESRKLENGYLRLVISQVHLQF